MAEATANSPSVVPEAALDRILEALWRSWKYLDGEKQRKLNELFKGDTLIAFGVLIAAWIGFQFLGPIAWAADAVLSFIGALGFLQDALELKDAVFEAANATTDAALELAAQHMARGFTDLIVDGIATLIGHVLFGKLRSLIRSFRGRLLPTGSRFAGAPEGPAGGAGEGPETKPAGDSTSGNRPSEPGERSARPAEEPGARKAAGGRPADSGERSARPAEEPGTRLTDYAVGAGVGVGLVHGAPVLGSAIEKFRLWPWVLGGLLGTTLVIAGAASMRRQPARRPIYGG